MAYESVPAAPTRRSRTTKTVLVVVAVVFGLCCVGGTVGGVFIYRGVKGAVGAVNSAHATAEIFLTHLEHGQVDAAYEQLCSATRQSFSRERFAQTVAARPRLTRYALTNVKVSNVNGTERASAEAQMTYPDGSADGHTFEIVTENGWKVCGNPY